MVKSDTSVYGNPLSNPIQDSSRNIMGRLLDKVPARFTLYLMSLTGFIVSFIIRSDINMAILAMVKDQKRPSVDNSSRQYCYNLRGTGNGTDAVVDYGGTLEWSPEVQSYILSSFFWIYFLTQIIGGAAAQKFGTKRVFGYAQLATALCAFCIPWTSGVHYGLIIFIRLLQGFAMFASLFQGFTWSAMYSIVGHWIPVQERSRFMTSFQGYNIGTGLSYWLCGFIIEHFGWRYVFYTTGTLGVVWCIMWYFLTFDSPESHPRISTKEKEYIRKNTDTTFLISRENSVPWCSILLSLPAWAIAITSFGRVWVTYTFIISGPQYMKSVLGFNAEQNGMLSGTPFILGYLSSLVFAFISDKLIIHKVLSMTNCRKLFTFLSQIIPGIGCILIGYLGCNITAILIVWFLAVAMLTASFSGVMANIVDIAPNFSGPVLGFTQTILMSPGMFAPLTVGYLTRDGNTLSAWRTIFNISGVLSILTYVVYQIWGTAEIQPWNYRGNEVARREESKNVPLLGNGGTTQNTSECPNRRDDSKGIM